MKKWSMFLSIAVLLVVSFSIGKATIGTTTASVDNGPGPICNSVVVAAVDNGGGPLSNKA